MSRLDTIRTYTTQEFKDQFINTDQQSSEFFRPNFETFFCFRIEDVVPLAKFPIPPSREISHSLILITEGSYCQEIGATQYEVKKNEVLSIPSGQIFSVQSIDKQVKGYTCHFHPNFLNERFGHQELLDQFDFLKYWGNLKIKLDDQTAGFILNLFNRMALAYMEYGTRNVEIIQAYLYALLSEVHHHSKPHHTKKYSAAARISRKFKELIYSSEETRLTVGQYADLLNISASHLNKSVKNFTGKSPIRWIDEITILKSKHLLYQTTFSISEIASQVGIIDQSYFSRLFKKHEGMTPTDFRKMIEKS